MKKTKAKPKKTRVRRNPFARALDVAKNKYAKAVDEYERCQSRLDALSVEIPKLAGMISVLGGDVVAAPEPAAPQDRQSMEAHAILNQPLPQRVATGPRPTDPASMLPPHLRHMVKEHPSVARGMPTGAQGRVVAADVAEDDGLPAKLPGIEMLP